VVGRCCAVRARSGAEDVALTSILAARQRLLEPPVLIDGVVGHDVQQDVQTRLMRCCDELLRFGEGAEHRSHTAVVGHVMAAVDHRRGIPRVDPYGINPQGDEVVQMRTDSGNIADAIAITICKTARINLVDDSITPPHWSRLSVPAGALGPASSSARGRDAHKAEPCPESARAEA